MRKQVRFKIFKSQTKSWTVLFREVADFASEMRGEQLISISHSEDTNEGVVTVWFWE